MKVPGIFADIWAWLPWIVAAIAAFVSFVSNLLAIAEKLHKIKKWIHRRRARKTLESNQKLLEVELPSEL